MLFVLLSGGSAIAESPFADPNLLNRLLNEAGGDRNQVFRISTTEQSVAYPNLRDAPVRPSFDDLDAFLHVLNITKLFFVVDDKKVDIARGFGVNPATNWTVPERMSWLHDYVDAASTEFTIPVGLRARPKVLKTDEWTEGNSDFALAQGTYDYLDFLSQETVSGIPFKLIVERHPASDGWFLSSYKGVSSDAAKSGETQVGKAIVDFAREHAALLASRRAEAMDLAYAELRKTHFGNYRLKDGVLFIDLGEQAMLVDQRPTILSRTDSKVMKDTSLGAAASHCEAQETGGLANWELPGQVALARMLFGGKFEDWKRRMPIKDMPTGEFFELLLSRIPYRVNPPTILSKDEADSGQNLNNRVAYVIKFDKEARTFWGDAPFYKSSSFSFDGVAIVCVNHDAADIARFLGEG